MEQVKEEVNKGKMDIAKKASNKGFKVSDNAGSGNCLFHALSEQLELVKRMRVPYQELRNTLVQSLREHPNLVSVKVVLMKGHWGFIQNFFLALH